MYTEAIDNICETQNSIRGKKNENDYSTSFSSRLVRTIHDEGCKFIGECDWLLCWHCRAGGGMGDICHRCCVLQQIVS